MHVNAWELYNKCRNLYIIEWYIRVTLELDRVFFFSLHPSSVSPWLYLLSSHTSYFRWIQFVLVRYLVSVDIPVIKRLRKLQVRSLLIPIADFKVFLIWMMAFVEIVVIFIWSICCYFCLFRIIMVLLISQKILCEKNWWCDLGNACLRVCSWDWRTLENSLFREFC